MQNQKPTPLCSRSDIMVYRPQINFFVKKIRQQIDFSFTRQMHGLWDAVIAAWIINPDLRIIRLSDKNYIEELASTMSKAKLEMDNLYYSPSFYVELINILKSLKANDTDFLFGVSDTSFFPETPPPYIPSDFANPKSCRFNMLSTKDHLNYFKLRFGDRQSIIKLLIPGGYQLYDGMIWKLYCYNNEIWEFFSEIKDHPIVLIGPTHYKKFSKIAGFSNYHHIAIHESQASETRDIVLNEIIQKHENLADSAKFPIYFFVAGSISVYWIYHLHHNLNNKYLIDVGQAFNFLFDSKSSLIHREFGYSKVSINGRKKYQTKSSFGKRSFQSKMTIENNQVSFELKLKLQEIWFPAMIRIISKYVIDLYRLRRILYRIKHNLFGFVFPN